MAKLEGAYRDYYSNNLDTVQGRAHFNLESKRKHLQERVKGKIAKWYGKDNRTLLTQQMIQVLKTYEGVPGTMEGVLFAIEDMAPELKHDSKTSIDKEGARTLKGLMNVLGSDPMHKAVCNAAQNISKHMENKEIVTKNVYFIIYDSDFREKHNGYNSLDSLINADLISTAYEKYDSFIAFFRKFGGVDVEKAPIICSKYLFKDSNCVGEYLPKLREIHLDISAKKDSIVHELAHSRQFDGRSMISYGKELGTNSLDITKVLLEAGALFGESLYSVSLVPVDKLKVNLTTHTLKSVMKLYLSYPDDIEDKVLDRAAGLRIRYLYNTMREADNPHAVLAQLFHKSTLSNPTSKYYDGAAFALLLFAANDFNIRQTMAELTTLEHPSAIIDKLSGAIKQDSNFKILEKL